jgi:hypothetical protein
VKDANFMIIESNYDPLMLKESSYPSHLKARIAGATGTFQTRTAPPPCARPLKRVCVREIILGI